MAHLNELLNKLKWFYSSVEVVWILNASTSSDITSNNLLLFENKLGHLLFKSYGMDPIIKQKFFEEVLELSRE